VSHCCATKHGLALDEKFFLRLDSRLVSSGYIPVGGLRKLFYWFIEAQENVATAPLVFWYQGGPGCSGLAGLLTENGPLVANKQGGLDYNPISWTNKHSVVFLVSVKRFCAASVSQSQGTTRVCGLLVQRQPI
jgi:hypothetical protein